MSTIDMPGLAMTRSLGDKVGAQAGVICEAGMKMANKFKNNLITTTNRFRKYSKSPFLFID